MSETSLADLASVVICVRNRAALIGETLRSVVRNKPNEIVVIDDLSTDDTATIARSFTERVIPSGGHGLAAARQLGAELAVSSYVMYVDSDVVLEDGCIAGLVEALEADPSLGAARATLLETNQSSYWGRAAQEAGRIKRKHRPPDAARFSCSAVAIRRQVILDVRFDPFFSGAGEDIDFSRRLSKAGWHILRCPVVARHRRRDGCRALFQQRVWYGRGAARLALRANSNFADDKDSSTAPGKVPLLLRLFRERRSSLIPYFVVSNVAYRIGWFAEMRALRGRTLPPGPSESSASR